jgi:hypothetical protein
MATRQGTLQVTTAPSSNGTKVTSARCSLGILRFVRLEDFACRVFTVEQFRLHLVLAKPNVDRVLTTVATYNRLVIARPFHLEAVLESDGNCRTVGLWWFRLWGVRKVEPIVFWLFSSLFDNKGAVLTSMACFVGDARAGDHVVAGQAPNDVTAKQLEDKHTYATHLKCALARQWREGRQLRKWRQLGFFLLRSLAPEARECPLNSV